MNGYPKYVAVKQDYINLLCDPVYRGQAIDDLQAICDLDDDLATRSIGVAEDGTEITETIPNPMPLWKAKGFESRSDVSYLIAEYGGEVQP